MSPKIASSIDLRSDAREKAVALLGPVLAGAAELALSAKEAHWNVKGGNFIALHGLFDALHAAAAGYADDLAERIVQLGGHAHGTLQALAKASALPAYPGDLTQPVDHFKALIAQLAALGAQIRQGIEGATVAGDAGTADLFTEVSRGLDKQLWFLEAHLG